MLSKGQRLPSKPRQREISGITAANQTVTILMSRNAQADGNE